MAKEPFRVEYRGVDEVVNRFDRFGSEWNKEQVKATEIAGTYVLQNLKPYPGKPVLSKYARTGTLGKTLNRKAKRTSTGVVGVVGSPVSYSPWVISTTAQRGAGPQTSFHSATGWWTLQNEVKRLRKGIIGAYKDALARVKRNSG